MGKFSEFHLISWFISPFTEINGGASFDCNKSRFVETLSSLGLFCSSCIPLQKLPKLTLTLVHTSCHENGRTHTEVSGN